MAEHDPELEPVQVAQWVATVFIVIFLGAGSLFAYYNMHAEEYRSARIFAVESEELQAADKKAEGHLAGAPVQSGEKAIAIDQAMAQIVKEGSAK